MSNVTIPDTQVFKDKALKVASAYHDLALLRLADWMQKDTGITSTHSLESLKEVDNQNQEFMGLLGWPTDDFSDKNLYNVEGRSVTRADHIKAVTEAEKTFRETKNSLYTQAMGVNSDLLRKTLSSFATKLDERDNGKRKVEQSLNDLVAKTANENGFRMPSDMQYYDSEKSMQVG